MEEATLSQMAPSYEQPKKRGPGKIILPIIIVIILLGIILGGTLYLRSKQESIPTPTPFPTPMDTPILDTPTPEASPTPEITGPTKKVTPTPKTASSSASTTTSSKGLSLRVLNGSGEAGKAGVVANYLKGLGYGISATGNADSFGLDKTTVSIKASKQSLLSGLVSDLSSKYSVGTTSATLSSSDSVDAVVTVGKL